MRVLLVEDDFLQAEWLRESLRRNFSSVEVVVVKNESSFREQISDLLESPPDLVLMDVMLRWCDPNPGSQPTPAPEEVRQGGYYRAGFRCLKLLLENEETSRIP